MTEEVHFTTTIEEISQMNALEENNKSRARLLQIELKQNMKPIQKVLRASQYN